MDRRPQDPHSSSEKHTDPIGHSQGHRLDPTDPIGKELRKSEQATGAGDSSVAKGGASTDASNHIKNREEEGGSGIINNFQPQSQPRQQGLKGGLSGLLKGSRKKGPLTAIVVFIAIGLFTGVSFFTTLLAPFAFFANVRLDLNDIASINSKRTIDQIGEKFIDKKTASDKVTLGCIVSKLPRKCRLKTVSPWLEEKLKQQGIKIVGSERFGGRVVPESYIDVINGKSYNAQEFTKAIMGGDPDIWARYNKALNSNWLAFKGKTFIKGVLAKYGLTERPRQLSGDSDEMFKQIANGEKPSGNTGEVTLKEAYDPDTKERIIDPDSGEAMWEDDSGRRYTESQKEKIMTSGSTEALNSNTKTIGQMSVGTLEKVGLGINVLGFADAACTVRNMIGYASTAAKVSNAGQLAKYAMETGTLVSKLQAGETPDPEEAEAVQRIFTDTDAREYISGFIGNEEGSGNELKAGKVKNPDFGRNVMDSRLYKASAGDGIEKLSLNESNYSLGYGAESILATITNTAFNITNFVSTVKNIDGCNFIQNGAVRVIGIGVGVAITIAGAILSPTGIGVGVLAVQGAKGIATIIGFTIISMVLSRSVNAIYTNSLITDSMDESPLERGAALWTGLAVIVGANAQMRGMMPGSANEIIAYQKEQNIARQQYIALQRQESNPLDVTNPYSLVGSLALAIDKHIPDSPSTSSLATLSMGMSSFIVDGFSSFLKPYSAQAASLDPERFKQCDDEGYRDIGIDADLQCNVRYVMPKASTKWSPVEAAQLMEDGGFVEKNTETGYPKGYTPPSPEKLQSGAMNMIKGQAENFVKGIINDVYNTENYDKYNDDESNPNGGKYAKFLDYCVYRAMPFGKTYEEDGSIVGSIGRDWIDGSKCRDTSDEDINLFRIYVFDMSVDDDLDGPIQDPYCAPSGLSPGSAVGKASAGEIDAAIEASEKNNPNNPHPLHGKGAAIIELSNKYGVNSDFIAVTLHAETQFGTDGAGGPVHNNFGWNKYDPDVDECGGFMWGGSRYNCYNEPETGIEGILKNLTGNPLYKTVTTDPATGPTDAKPGTIAAVRPHYCPNWDGDCNLTTFIASGEKIGIPIAADDPVFGSASAPGASSAPSSVQGNSLKLGKKDVERKIATYGLPGPLASGDNGYEALAKKLKEDPNALWSAQSFLTGEKNAIAKGIDVKQYLTTAWVWFETGAYPDLYEVNCRSNTEHPTNEVCNIDYGDNDKVQVAGYQAWDVMDKYTEIYNKLYTESELQAIMEKVIDNSSKASIDPWKYKPEDKEKVKGVTLADIYPSGSRDFGAGDDAVFNDEKRQFLSFILGKDPNMAAALNSFAVSEDDVIKHISGPGCGPGWATYICDDEKQLISNMIMALSLIDDGTAPSSDVQCAGTAANRGFGEGIEAVWGGQGEKDLSYGFDYGPAAGPWYSYSTAYGMGGFTHTGTDIPMDPYAPVYSPVEGNVMCDRNGSGDGLPGIGCAGSADYSLTGDYGCVGEPGKPGGAGTILIEITENGQPTGHALRLGHLAESLVKLGDKVTANQQVGLAGCMNGWHTHVEYFIPAPGVTSSGWKLVDPVEYLGGGKKSA